MLHGLLQIGFQTLAAGIEGLKSLQKIQQRSIHCINVVLKMCQGRFDAFEPSGIIGCQIGLWFFTHPEKTLLFTVPEKNPLLAVADCIGSEEHTRFAKST